MRLRKRAKSLEIHPVSAEELDQLVLGSHQDPHQVLGAHMFNGQVTVRVLAPLADEVNVVLENGQRIGLAHEYGGIFVGVIDQVGIPHYRVAIRYGDSENVGFDPYCFLPTIGDLDLHLISEGRHEHLWETLGANIRYVPLPGKNEVCRVGAECAGSATCR
jgi:1,4-alpha-glucan branching enzyme